MGQIVKNLSIVSLSLAILLVLFADYGFERNRAESIVTRIVVSLNPLPAPEASEPSLKPTPFYQIEKNATYILIASSLLFLFIAISLEIKALSTIGRNNKSAGVIAICLAVCSFNLLLAMWNM